MIVVSNSTPLIVLSKTERLGLLKELFTSVLIPDAVRRELFEHGADKPGIAALRNANWIETRTITGNPSQAVLKSVDLGEFEAVQLAHEVSANLILMDDQAGRKEAIKRGLPLMGTVGILQFAKAKGLIQSLKPEMDRLVNDGFFISDALYTTALQQAGEQS
jgi:uncharacterized protein